MHRLLIVDDERHVVNAMETLFLSKNDTELEVYTATLAAEALEIMEKVKIDVLLSDIKMPEMDGFMLADRVKEGWPDAKIIFLTAYNDFDLAYKTGKYGDVAFLLKMEDEEVIADTVFKTLEKLDRERQEKNLLEDSLDLQEIFRISVKNAMLRDLVAGDQIAANAEITLELDPEKPVFTILFRNTDEKALPYSERDRYLAKLAGILKNVFRERANCELMRYQGENYAFLLQWKAEELPKRIVTQLSMMADEMMERLEEGGCGDMAAAVIGWQMDISGAKEILEHFRDLGPVFEAGSCRLFTREDMDLLQNRASSLLWKARFDSNTEKIRTYLTKGNKAGILHELRPIAVASGEVDSMHFYPLIVIFQKLGSMILEYANDRNLVNALSFKIGIYKLFSITEFSSWQEAFGYLDDVIEALFAAADVDEKNGEDRFVSTIRRYVEAHLSEDLSLTTISGYMNYNPSYVSRTFKKLTGRNLVEYIIAVRLEKAAELLTGSGLSINEIAERCGFVTRQYFSTSFKKKYEMSPQDYRHQHIKK